MQITATEVGKALIGDAQVLTPGNVATLTGAAITFVIVSLNTNTRASYAGSVGTGGTFGGTTYASGTYGTYTTVGTEFPAGGRYEVQMLASFNGGSQVLKSPPYLINVDPAL